MKNVLIFNGNARRYKQLLEPDFPDVRFHAAENQAALDAVIGDTHILIAVSHELTDDIIGKAPELEWIQSLISGTDAFLTFESLRKDVLITSARRIHGPQMSEMAFLHMLNLTRNYPKMLRNQDMGIWERWPQPLLYKKKVGLLGVGIIAEELARKCKAFNMTVYGISATKREVEGIDRFFGREQLCEVAAEVDYLIVLIPYSAETDKMINAEVLSAMKPSAYLINIARGGVLDEHALIEALKAKKIAGAGLDVYSQEPLPADHPFWKMDNLMMTPKVGGMSNIYVEQVLPILKTNLHHYINEGRNKMINIVSL